MLETEIILGALAVVAIVAAVRFCAKSKSDKKKQESKGEDEKEMKLEEPIKQIVTPDKAEKKKKKKTENSNTSTVQAKSQKELEEIYGEHLYGSISLKSNKNISTITCITLKNSKILVGNSRNELVLYDLRKWKPHTPFNQQFFTTLDNNSATAVAISPNYYFAALDFEKTIIYFEFKGGEGGVYFREVKKFPRNIFKGNQGSMHVPDSERFVVSTGIEADTTINVWSMNGQKLASVSTYQIEHYDVKYGGELALVRGWTSEVKSFYFNTDKDGSFSKLEKSVHLTLSEKPLASVIDNFGYYALTITGDGEQIKLWQLSSNLVSHPIESTVESCQVGLNTAKYCSIVTNRSQNQRLRTILVVANDTKMVLLDRFLKPIKQIQGVALQNIYSFGTSRSTVFGSFFNGKLSVWDFTKLTLEQPEYLRQ